MTEQLISSPATGDPMSETPRVRVRTPGKHIVLFLLAVTFMLTLSTSLISSGQFEKQSRAPTPAASDYELAPMEFLVDLSEDDSGRVAYLKMSTVIYAADEKSKKALEAQAPQIRERITFFLRALTPEDFQNEDAMAGVKAELLRRINLSAAPAAAATIAVNDLVIQ